MPSPSRCPRACCATPAGPPGYDANGYGTALGYVWPATEQDYDSPWTYGGALPMGSLVAIPRSVDITQLGLNPQTLAIARALQDYGGYIVDRAGDGTVALYAEPGVPEQLDRQRHRADVVGCAADLRSPAVAGRGQQQSVDDRRRRDPTGADGAGPRLTVRSAPVPRPWSA